MVYQLDLRKSIYQLVGQRKIYEIYQLFKDNNIWKSIIKDCQNDLSCLLKPKIAKLQVGDSKKVRNVLQSFKNRVGASSRLVARKTTSHTLQFFELWKKTISSTKNEFWLANSARENSSLLLISFLPNIFVTKKWLWWMMRSILYFHTATAPSQEFMVSGQTIFETLLTPLNTKLLECLVWCEISEDAVLTLFMGNFKGQAVNADVYITKCLPKMVKFIEKHHKNDETIFWLELASCYYAK
jgi:hypothetical protein